MKTIKKVKYKSGDLILRKNAGLILLVTLVIAVLYFLYRPVES